MTIDLVLIGFGHVGRRFVTLLRELSDVLDRDHAVAWRVLGIATKRHGTTIDPGGLDTDRALALVKSGGSLKGLTPSGITDPMDALSLLAMLQKSDRSAGGTRVPGPLVMVETTVLDIAKGQPAIDHVHAAFRSGAHVISANKGPVAFAFHELQSEAAARGLTLRFESAVMDGIPIFNFVRETLPAVHITGFRGVINSTTNHILTAMEAGSDFASALADMQAQGIAEADPSLDVDGWDAAAKTAALANVLMEARITPHDVHRTGIRSLTGGQIAAAVQAGRRLKLVASAQRRGDGVDARVEPVEVPLSDPLGGVSGMANLLILHTDLLGAIAVTQLAGGLTQTAYGLVADLVSLTRR